MNNWHRFLSLISLAYRSCVHPALGETPFFLERGRDPIVPAEIQPMPNSTGVKNKSASEYRLRMMKRLRAALSAAALLDFESRQRAAAYYNKNKQVVEFQVDDLVWIFRDPPTSTNSDLTRRSLHFLPRTTGPWRIVTKVSGLKYEAVNVRTHARDCFMVDELVSGSCARTCL